MLVCHTSVKKHHLEGLFEVTQMSLVPLTHTKATGALPYKRMNYFFIQFFRIIE